MQLLSINGNKCNNNRKCRKEYCSATSSKKRKLLKLTYILLNLDKLSMMTGMINEVYLKYHTHLNLTKLVDDVHNI